MRIRLGITLGLFLMTLGCRKEQATAPAPPPAVSTAATSSEPPAAATNTEEATSTGDPQVALAARLADYNFRGADGQQISLKALRGRAVLLNVWATWCTPCRQEIPELNKIAAANAHDGLEVIGVSIDAPGTESDVMNFVREQKMTYQIAFDTEEHVANLLQTTFVPTTVLLDRQGNVVQYSVGLIDSSKPAFEQALRRALRK